MDEISNFREVLRKKLDSHISEEALKKEITQLLSAVDEMEPDALGCRSLRSFWQESETKQGVMDCRKPINSGFGSLDLLCGGFYPGELIILGGRPSMGKTQFLVNMALNIAAERGVLFYSFDLSPFLLSNRFVSAAARIPVGQLLSHHLNHEERERIQLALDAPDAANIHLKAEMKNDFDAIAKEIATIKHTYDTGMVILDYLQLMQVRLPRTNRDMQVGHLCRELKKLAQELKIVIVVASQLNRSVEMRYQKRPVLSDLRDSGSIEQDADKVLFIYRPEYYGIEEDAYGITTSNTVELILAKNRIGKTGTVQLLRDEGFTFFESYDARTARFLIDPQRRQDLEFQ